MQVGNWPVELWLHTKKNEERYNLGTLKLDYIRELYPSLNVCFEHVPREENTLCDAVCNLITNQMQMNLVETIHDLILLDDSFKVGSNQEEVCYF